MEEFYPFYLSQHLNVTNRKIHFVGTSLSIICFTMFLYYLNSTFLIMIPICGYGCAWFGHFYFELNKPATFNNPFYSLAGDFIMFYKMLVGNLDEDFKRYNLTSC